MHLQLQRFYTSLISYILGIDAQYGYCSGSEIGFSDTYSSAVECFDICRSIDEATGCTYEMDLQTCAYYTMEVTFAAGRDGVISDPDSQRTICWLFN